MEKKFRSRLNTPKIMTKMRNILVKRSSKCDIFKVDEGRHKSTVLYFPYIFWPQRKKERICPYIRQSRQFVSVCRLVQLILTSMLGFTLMFQEEIIFLSLLITNLKDETVLKYFREKAPNLQTSEFRIK